MTKEKLAELGLTEEQTAAVLEAMKGFVPKHRFDELNEKLKTAEEAVKTRDSQIAELGKSGDENSALKAEIEKIKKANADSAAEYEAKIEAQWLDNAIERALMGAKARNLTAAKACIKADALKRDGDNVIGLADQIKALTEGDDTKFLFGEEKPAFAGLKPMESSPAAQPDDFLGGFNGKGD